MATDQTTCYLDTIKAYKEIKDLTKGLLTENWFLISYELTYQNDTFNKMSDGKKAFAGEL
jgi:hypothetical protein